MHPFYATHISLGRESMLAASPHQDQDSSYKYKSGTRLFTSTSSPYTRRPQNLFACGTKRWPFLRSTSQYRRRRRRRRLAREEASSPFLPFWPTNVPAKPEPGLACRAIIRDWDAVIISRAAMVMSWDQNRDGTEQHRGHRILLHRLDVCLFDGGTSHSKKTKKGVAVWHEIANSSLILVDRERDCRHRRFESCLSHRWKFA